MFLPMVNAYAKSAHSVHEIKILPLPIEEVLFFKAHIAKFLVLQNINIAVFQCLRVCLHLIMDTGLNDFVKFYAMFDASVRHSSWQKHPVRGFEGATMDFNITGFHTSSR